MGFLSSIAPFMGAVGMAVAIWLYMTAVSYTHLRAHET